MYHSSCVGREMNCVSFHRWRCLLSFSHLPLRPLCYRFDTAEAYVVREMTKMVCRFVVVVHKETFMIYEVHIFF